METWSLVEGRWATGDAPEATARWFNLTGPGGDEFPTLAARLGLHDLSVEDCRSLAFHASKIDEFDDHLFIVLHAFTAAGELPVIEELDAFLGRDFLVTYQERPLPALAEVAAFLAAGRVCRPGPDGLLYEIIDRTTDDALPVVERLGERLEAIQERAIEGDISQISNAVPVIRAHISRVRRVLSPEQSVLQRLSRGEFPYVADVNQIYFRDVYDHLVRLDFALEGLREDTEVALNTYLSVINNRMNEVMKVLSVVSALALPAVVIAGIFGTNFDNVPGLHSNWGFATMMASIIGLGAGMGWYFRRRGWF